MSNEKATKKPKAFKLIGSFTPLELKRFGRFLQSPYHNTNKAVVLLFDQLKKYYPNFDSNKLTAEKLFAKVYEKQAFNAAKLQHLYAHLSALAEDFLLTEYLAAEQQKKRALLVEVLAKRNFDLFQKEAHKLIREINNKPIYKEATDYLILHQLQHLLWYHLETEKFTANQSSLLDSQIHLDTYFRLKKLGFATSLAVRSNYLNTQSAPLLAELKNQFIDKEKNNSIEYELLFTKIFQLHQAGDLESYLDLKHHVFLNFDQLSVNHQNNFLLHLINFVISFKQSNEVLPADELWQLYKLGVTKKLFIQNDRMRDIEFANICIAGFHSKKEAWTQEFIAEHQQYLLPTETEYLIPFVEAYGQFFNQKFEKVIELLSKVNPTNNLKYLCRIKSLLIRAFFECILLQKGNYMTVLQAQLDSFKKLMERNQKNAAIRTSAYLNFIILCKKLLPLLDKQMNTLQEIVNLEQLFEQTVTKGILP